MFKIFSYSKNIRRNTRNFRTGFTLVELLVVISIISLLSSIILASLNSARLKADNIVRLQQMEQYKFAVFNMVSDRGTPAGLASYPNLWCIGVYPGNKCAFFGEPAGAPTWLTDEQLNNNFKTYISLPTLKRVVQSNGKVWDGPMYGCGIYVSGAWESSHDDDVPSTCTPILKWAMQGENQQCLPGAEVDTSYPGITYCILPVPYY